jgi:hypothetical protein
MVVLARDYDVGICRNDDAREILQHPGRLVRFVFLVHLVQQRQGILQRIDQGDFVPALDALVDDEPRRFYTLSRRAHGTVEDDCIQRHVRDSCMEDGSILTLRYGSISVWCGAGICLFPE